MKLKYYLRGLAVGILITTIILAIANRDNRPLTDAQIRQRALELGMVEEDSQKLSSLQSTESENSPESSVPDSSPESTMPGSNEENSVGSGEENSSADSSPESAEESSVTESSPESTVVQSAVESFVTESNIESGEVTDARPVVLQIKSGASSYTVSRDLAALGLVEDASAYDQFLCNNGYSKKIHVGTYEIMPGTSEEDIAKLIAQ